MNHFTCILRPPLVLHMSRKSLCCGKAMGIAITTNITGINKDQNVHPGVYDGSVYYIPTRRVDSTLTRDFDSSNSATRPTLATMAVGASRLRARKIQ